MNSHIQSVHDGKKTFKHSISRYAASSQKGSLKMHIESVHEAKKPFLCNDCLKFFSERTSEWAY